MRVLFEPHEVSHYTEGLTRALHDLGCDVAVFQNHHPLIDALADLRRLRAANLARSVHENVEFIKAAKDFDVVHLNHVSQTDWLAISKALHKGVIVTFHSPVTRPLGLTRYRTLRRFYVYANLRLASKTNVTVATISRYAAETMRQNLRIDPVVVYYGVRTDIFHPSEASDDFRRSLGISPERLMVVWAGRGLPYKDPFTFLRATLAFRKHASDIAFIMALRSPRPLDSRIFEFIDGYRLDHLVYPVRPVPFKRMPEIYASADFLVHTSPEEGFGMVVLEAMASGLPVIVADQGAPSEFVGEGGLLFRSRDDQDLAQKIALLKGDPERRAEMGQAASLIANTKFTWRSAGERYLELYEKLV